MDIKGLLERHETKTVEFRNLITTFLNSTVTKSYPVSADLTVEKIIYWTGRSADRMVSEQIRPDVVGLVIMDPDDYTTVINEDAKATIDGQDYSVITVEDVAGQGQVIQVPLKRYKK